ncbi:diguanylate cyclase domain-containing protein [Pararhizobium sp.]|uniref:GGDEF domain-containing protein n=1 Tax=Pararhizobium sp. TaxID=1977563 RepID=UPI003D129898
MSSSSQFGHSRIGRYARQLDAGIGWLRFQGDMEREYALQIDRDERRPAMVSAVFSLVFIVLFGISDFIRLPLVTRFPDLSADMWGILTSRWVAVLFLLGCLYICHRQRGVSRAAPLSIAAVLTLAVSGAVSVCLYKRNGLGHAEFAQLLFVMGAFSPLGLRFRHSIMLAAGVVALTFLLRYWLLPAELREQQFDAMLLLTLVFAAVGGYLRERAHREQFLLRGILKEQASRDPLTGLANRRGLDEQLETIRRQARQESQPVGLLLLDVDFFKRYNDRYGHQAGDLALQRVAACLDAFAHHPLDMACRMGGEEFALVLYGCGEAALKDRADTLCADVRNLRIDHATSDICAFVTVSIGGVLLQPQETAWSALDRADQLLYEAKREGRNRTSVERLLPMAAVA